MYVNARMPARWRTLTPILTFPSRPSNSPDDILLERIHLDPLLSSFSVVIVDEVHERSARTDCLLGLLKKILKYRRHDFRVVIMSASLDVAQMCSFFGSGNAVGNAGTNRNAAKSATGELSCSSVYITGRSHPVDIMYLDKPCQHYLRTAVDTIRYIHSTETPGDGDILVFLPNSFAIEECMLMLNDHAENAMSDNTGSSMDDSLLALPLYTTLPHTLQLRVFMSAFDLYVGRAGTPATYTSSAKSTLHRQALAARKVILATNMAECGVTIPSVKYVVDCGLQEVLYTGTYLVLAR